MQSLLLLFPTNWFRLDLCLTDVLKKLVYIEPAYDVSSHAYDRLDVGRQQPVEPLLVSLLHNEPLVVVKRLQTRADICRVHVLTYRGAQGRGQVL